MSPNFYNENVIVLDIEYLSKSFEAVHHRLFQFLSPIIENPKARILDLGAGLERITKYFTQFDTKQTEKLNVKRLENYLSALANIIKNEVNFMIILLSTGWLYIAYSERARSIRKLFNLLNPSGKPVFFILQLIQKE